MDRVLSTHFGARHPIRVGWLSLRPLTDVEQVLDLPDRLPPVTVDDDGTTITQAGRGSLAVTTTTADGVEVRAVTAQSKSKLLSFPGGRFDTRDEDKRARYGFYALTRRAAEAAALRAWATATLAGAWAAVVPGPGTGGLADPGEESHGDVYSGSHTTRGGAAR